MLAAARSIDVRACEAGCVDVYDSLHASDILHVRADQFAAFVTRVKAGEFDGLCPAAPPEPTALPAGPGL